MRTIYFSKEISLALIIIVSLFINSPLGMAEAINLSPPPVEKVKPSKRKLKRENKIAQRKFKKQIKRWKKQLRKHPEQTQDIVLFFIVGLLLLWLIVVAGAIMFGLGQSVVALWFAGMLLMGIGNVAASVLSAILIGKVGGEGVVSNFTAGAIFIFLVLLIVTDLAAGLAFLIWGLLAGLSMVWIIGLILLVLMLVALIIFILSINGMLE